MLKDHLQKFTMLCEENNIIKISNNSSLTIKLSGLYMFYQYFNADETVLDTLDSSLIINDYIEGIFESDQDENVGYDLIKSFDSSSDIFDLDHIDDEISKIDYFFAQVFSGKKSISIDTIRNIFIDLNITEDNKLHYIILSDTQPNPDKKRLIKDFISNYKSRINNLNYIIFFADDIEEFISDIDSPSLTVQQGRFLLTDKNQFLFHGPEKSMVTSISAKSLKDIFLKYSTKGLFSSNLRYYVKSAKIDSNIKNSIINEPEKFWYFNNGLIITCRDYKVNGDYLELFDFSIVNGGQTTNLIGNTPFEEDFSIICKVIKTKYKDEEENLVFLSKVAETSNTQKPIKTKDIIANRIEQIKLKQQLNKVNVYVQVKRGEKINKLQFPEKWQNAANDEIGQMLFSMVYQHPGIARNSKSKMLENEVYYNTIFRNEYNTFFLLSLQHFKVGYHKWALKAKKINDSSKQGLSRNGFFLFCGIFGFILKVFYNQDFYQLVLDKHISHDFTTDEDFKRNIAQNDIGTIPIFRNPSTISSNSISEGFFDYLYDYFVLPAYQFFKSIYPNSAYSNFTKTDSFYYRTVIPKLVGIIHKNWENGIKHKEFFTEYLIKDNHLKLGLPTRVEIFEDYKPGLSQELSEYRKTKYYEYQGKIEGYKIFTNRQKAHITFKKPRSISALRNDCELSEFSIKNFGEDILKIVRKYVIL